MSFAEFCRVLLLAFADRRLVKNKQNVAVPQQELENRQATPKKQGQSPVLPDHRELIGSVNTAAFTRTLRSDREPTTGVTPFLSYTWLAARAKVKSSRDRTNVGKRLPMLPVYLLAAYVLLLIAMRLFERRMVFFPDYPSRLEGNWHPRALGPVAARVGAQAVHQ